MKKSLPIIICSIITVGGIAQNKLVSPAGTLNIPAAVLNQSVKANSKPVTDGFDKFTAPLNSSIGSGTNSGMNTLADVVFLGNTKYQLQSNGSTRNALVENTDGTKAAVWSFSKSNTPYADRGTGYAYFNGTTWSTPPTDRIESERNGWPSITVTGSGKEVIITHNNVTEQLQVTSRAAKGTGAWIQQKNLLNQDSGIFWPRIAVGGTNKNSLHVIGVTTGRVNKQFASLMYSRSQDEGATWDKINQINPEHDSLAGFNGFGGDSYAIDARGNTIAYTSGSITSDWFIMKSTDNGATWTKKIALDFPFNNFNDQITDVNNDQLIDTLAVSDGNYSILIDNNDKVHVFSGLMRMLNDDDTDTTYSYFPGTNGILYWNENMPSNQPQVIAGLVDIGTPGFTFPSGQSNWGYYGPISLTSHPSAGIDASGNIYLAYDALLDGGLDPFQKGLRNIFLTMSSDGGTTWSEAIRAASSIGDGAEQVFPSVSRNVYGNCVGIVFQQDYVAGHGVAGVASTPTSPGYPDIANNAGENAEMNYICLTPSEILSTNTIGNKNVTVSQNYPNPFSGLTSFDITLVKNENVSIDVYNLMGQKAMASENKNLTTGKNTIDLNCTSLNAGMYFYTITVGNQRLTKRMIIK